MWYLELYPDDSRHTLKGLKLESDMILTYIGWNVHWRETKQEEDTRTQESQHDIKLVYVQVTEMRMKS